MSTQAGLQRRILWISGVVFDFCIKISTFKSIQTMKELTDNAETVVNKNRSIDITIPCFLQLLA